MTGRYLGLQTVPERGRWIVGVTGFLHAVCQRVALDHLLAFVVVEGREAVKGETYVCVHRCCDEAARHR